LVLKVVSFWPKSVMFWHFLFKFKIAAIVHHFCGQDKKPGLFVFGTNFGCIPDVFFVWFLTKNTPFVVKTLRNLLI